MAKTKTAAAKRAVAPAIIVNPSKDDVREFGGGAIGTLNKTAASRSYAETDNTPNGTGKSAVRSRMEKLTPFETQQRIAELFPVVDPGEKACDCYIIVQELRVPRSMGGGFLLRADETVDADQATTSYGKIASIGPLAFTWEVTGETFAGGSPYKVGDIVRIPKSGGQEFLIDDIIFNYFKDRDVKGVIEDMRKIVAIYF